MGKIINKWLRVSHRQQYNYIKCVAFQQHIDIHIYMNPIDILQNIVTSETSLY